MLYRVNLVKKIVPLILVVFFLAGCKDNIPVKEKEIVKAPEKMDDQVADNIKASLSFAERSNGTINGAIKLFQFPLVNSFYEGKNYKRMWSSKEQWNPAADSMFEFIKKSKYYGLYPEDYHYKELDSLRLKISSDSLVRMDAIAWTKADLMLSDAFISTLKDIKEGRMVPDSLSIISKDNYRDSFFFSNLNIALDSANITALFTRSEPDNIKYLSLRESLPGFVDSMDTATYLYIDFPYTDTLAFNKQLHERLLQENIGDSDVILSDSVLRDEVKIYQTKRNLKVDGKAGEGTVNSLNLSDKEKFKRIAITLDRYKQLPMMPQTYIWANIPSFYLELMNADTAVFQSKIIVGKPTTQTPTLFSEISNMVIFPNWTIPESIIKKEILPALKKDPGYLARKGFSLVDYKGDEVDPYGVVWSKYKTGIPWKIVQGSGDDNALGIFKFNFYNPYSVYLHDTNQRYLFANSNRALSHGCVRVQKWQSLAFYIATEDSLATKKGHPAYNIDSLKTWIAKQNRKTVMIKKRLPLFIVYFTCVAKDGEIVVYNDIYNKDEDLAKKYFANK